MSIVIEKLSKAFGEEVIYDNFNLEIEEGSCTCIMGKSGVGKTTLLNILLGLDKDYAGNIKGLENKKISCVFQEDRLCENITAVFNIKMVTDISKKYSNAEILDILKKVGIDGFDKKPVSEYSGGMKRRVALVRALLADFDVLILDEPFDGLDEETKNKCILLIKEYTEGKTVILVTHSEEDAKLMNAKTVKL